MGATAIERGPGTAFGEEGESTLFSESVTVPIGTVSSGSSLLAVLAGYVLPGSSAPPTTLMLLMLVGMLSLALFAPRPRLSERVVALGLLGARSGHHEAVRRPG